MPCDTILPPTGTYPIYGLIDFELERHQNAKLYLLINKLGKEGWKMKIVTWVLMRL